VVALQSSLEPGVLLAGLYKTLYHRRSLRLCRHSDGDTAALAMHVHWKPRSQALRYPLSGGTCGTCCSDSFDGEALFTSALLLAWMCTWKLVPYVKGTGANLLMRPTCVPACSMQLQQSLEHPSCVEASPRPGRADACVSRGRIEVLQSPW
jgi:hypothetical protein